MIKIFRMPFLSLTRDFFSEIKNKSTLKLCHQQPQCKNMFMNGNILTITIKNNHGLGTNP